MIDRDRIHQALQYPPAKLGILEGPQSLRPQFAIHTFEVLASTNETLWQLVDQGASAGTVAIAAQQQAGRGQRGRQWQSHPGGLYLSLALEPDIPTSESAHLILCSAWGIAQSLHNLGIPVGLKWPNDLVVGGRKLGGILSETRVQNGLITKVIIGVGLNWHNPVPEMAVNLRTVLQEQSQIESLEHLAAIVLRGLVRGHQVFQQQRIEDVLQAYHRFLTNLNQAVVVDGHPGIVVGVSPSGELQVRLHPQSTHTPATEISLKPGTISLGYC